MTLITRYPVAPTVGGRPALAWNSGLSPNRRWLPVGLPASGAVSGWPTQYNDLTLPARDLTKPPSTATESGIRHMYTDGTQGQGLSVDIADPSTMRTVVIIARPNAGDVVGASGRIVRFGDTGVIQQQDADTVTASGGIASLTATRGKWHVYSISLPAVGATSSNGIFAVDGSSTTFPYTDAAWTASALRIASSSGTNGRQLRVLEIITSANTFTAAQLTALYAKAKAWYPGLNW